ncbi:hypothetical protein WHJ50_14460, partial [Staphylococcus aureus]|uniref:hypothetical protein n=1 Tax=Staphylococcus aureus TaxID=1280 RepID=UPI0039BEAEAD
LPLGQNVLLEPVPHKPSLELNIVVPEQYLPDIWEHVVIACGKRVPFDVQPGVRVLVDPTLLNQKDFEHQGRKVKLANWKDIQMILGVPGE